MMIETSLVVMRLFELWYRWVILGRDFGTRSNDGQVWLVFAFVALMDPVFLLHRVFACMNVTFWHLLARFEPV